jgi:hypothetical protein
MSPGKKSFQIAAEAVSLQRPLSTGRDRNRGSGRRGRPAAFHSLHKLRLRQVGGTGRREQRHEIGKEKEKPNASTKAMPGTSTQWQDRFGCDLPSLSDMDNPG